MNEQEKAKIRRGLILDTFMHEYNVGNNGVMDLECILNKAKKDFFKRIWNLTDKDLANKEFMSDFMKSLQNQVKNLEAMKAVYGAVSGEFLLWFMDWFGEQK